MKGKKVILLNDLLSDLDKDLNDCFYKKESQETGIIYRILNITNGKSYIGKAFSYEKHGEKNTSRYGARGRFRRHLSNKDSETANKECPIFYEALRNSESTDWFVFTIAVCSKKHLKKHEMRWTEYYDTSNPKHGYNYFVGDNKPNDSKHLLKYQTAKAESNVNRAMGGTLRRKENSKNLPPNINYRIKKRPDGTVYQEGYFVQIKLNGVLYNKGFLALSESMKSKLTKAKKQLELFKKEAKKSGSKTNKPGLKTHVIEI
jgi:hypothetical protein